MEKQIKIAEKLYECRDTARRFFRDEYKAKLEPYTSLIKQVMKANNEGELEALLRISKTNTFQDNAFGQMLFFAAAVELIEPETSNQ